MGEFEYRNKVLHVEKLSLKKLAKKYGTPLYVYSKAYLVNQFQLLKDAFKEINPLICYSVKANSNSSIIKTFLQLGSGFDVVSGGELFRAIKAGAKPSRIVFAGVGKTHDEICYAIKEGILFFTVESEAEAERIAYCARNLKTIARIAFRVNPDVDPKTHKYISTGKKENKFGLDMERVKKAYKRASTLKNLEICGIHMHIGSQILSPEPYKNAVDKILPLCKELTACYPSLRYLDIGGGIGIKYEPEQTALEPRLIAKFIVKSLKETKLSIIMEPGRFLVGNAGILLCRVQYVKESHQKRFIIVDAGMNDLIRPSLYQAYHEILPVKQIKKTVRGDLVGPICESGDFFAVDRDLPDVKEGDLVAIMSAGAYGFSMSSTYNSRPQPAEVMIEGAKAILIRRRSTYQDLILHEL